MIFLLPKLQEAILAQVVKLGPDVTALQVKTALKPLLPKEQTFGAIHTCMTRLEAKSLLTSYIGSPESRRGGRAPRLYNVTPKGKQVLDESLKSSLALQQIHNKLII